MSKKIIIAADELGKDACLELARALKDSVYAIKIHAAYDECGPAFVKELKAAGAARVWMDAKLHDIPNTVRIRARAFADAGVDMLSVHGSGGVQMMEAAKEGAPDMQIFAITVLTSLGFEQCKDIYGADVLDVVHRLALLAQEANMQGIVCSPQELASLEEISEISNLLRVVPGIRSAGKDTHDQRRVATPTAALAAGADYLVIGRQITQAGDPVAALEEIEKEIA